MVVLAIPDLLNAVDDYIRHIEERQSTAWAISTLRLALPFLPLQLILPLCVLLCRLPLPQCAREGSVQGGD